MRKEISEEIEIPEGIEAKIEENVIILKKEDLELRRSFRNFEIKKQENKLILYNKKSTKKEKKLIMTTFAHIKNMIRGLQNKFEYKLEICAVHFPMNVSYDKEKNEIIIKNFLGEKVPRIAKLPENVDVKINGNIIILISYDKEAAGLAAAIIERLSRVRGRDRRIFQDGIFLIEKPGRQL